MSVEENRSRPELPWAMWSGIAGALAAATLSVKGIMASGSSTAAIGFIFVPFIAIAAAVPAGVWGLALGTVVAHLRGLKRAMRPVLVMAWVVTLAVPAAIAWEVEKGLSLQAAVHGLREMDEIQLDGAFDDARFRRDKFFLGALAQHHAASTALLERIASLPDEELYERMGSVWDVMGENRKGLAVMRLVAAHPNAGAATLAKLAAAPRNDYVLGDVLRNPHTPLESMAPHLDSTEYLVEWGLALNPKTPRKVMDRLSRSANLYTRMNLTMNRGVPVEILESLSRDNDASVARNAALALERRGRNGAGK